MCLNPSLVWETKQHKRASLDCPAWARSGWCLEMIGWRQPPIRFPVWYSLTAQPECISGDSEQCNKQPAWLRLRMLGSKVEVQGTMWNRGSLWGVQSSWDVHCCLCGGQAGSPGKKPGDLLTCSLEICREWWWWWSGSLGVCVGAEVMSAFSLPVFLYSLDVKLVFLLTARPQFLYILLFCMYSSGKGGRRQLFFFFEDFIPVLANLFLWLDVNQVQKFS